MRHRHASLVLRALGALAMAGSLALWPSSAMAQSPATAPPAPPAAQEAAKEEFISMFMQGSRIGYSRSVERPQGSGKSIYSTSIIRAGMLGARVEMDIETVTAYGADGRMTSLTFFMQSAGRTLRVTADFGPASITAKSVSGGQTSQKNIPIPAGTTVVDDPAQHLIRKGSGKGSVVKFHVFDPNSLSLVPVTATDKGEQTVEFRGKQVAGRVIDVDDPRAPLSLLIGKDGRLVRATGPMGMEMVPEPKEQAMDLGEGGDIAVASSITPNRPLPYSAKSSEMLFSGVDLSRLPSDQGQTVAKAGAKWRVTVTPIDPAAHAGTLKVGQAGGQEEWTKPDLRVPSDQPVFKELAAKIIGQETNAVRAAEKLRKWVLGQVAANAGIGVMRDAREVLETKEGVCRDHAVLMAALLRSVGIPAKLVSGMVYQDGAFYYHAWVEVWNGSIWVPKDSTRPSASLTPGHVKIAAGSVADAFVSFLLDGARIELVRP